MSIYKSVAVAIFGSACFIFGHAYSAYYEGKRIKTLYGEYYERNNYAMHFIMEVNDFERLLSLQKRLSLGEGYPIFLEQMIELDGESLRNRIKRIEDNYKNISFQERELIYKDYVERAKKLLNEVSEANDI